MGPLLPGLPELLALAIVFFHLPLKCNIEKWMPNKWTAPGQHTYLCRAFLSHSQASPHLS